MEEEGQTMNSKASLRGLVAPVMLFAVGVALHEAAGAEHWWPAQHWNSFAKQWKPDFRQVGRVAKL
jgi:hypothetical protein